MTKAEENKYKYLQPPSWDEIEKFRKKCKVNMAQFERYFGIYKGTLRNIKAGFKKQLPAAHWHHIYEQIVPTYGDLVTKRASVSKPVSSATPHIPVSKRKKNVSDPVNSRIKNLKKK